MNAREASPEAEETPAGRQCLLSGVRPLTMRERLAFRALAPLAPRAAQRRCDHGLFDLAARAQTDLIDELRRVERAAAAPVSIPDAIAESNSNPETNPSTGD